MEPKFSLILALAALFLTGPLTSPTIAAPHDIRCRPGVHLSKERPLTEKQTTKLLKGLKFWTGFNEIGIDGAGAVTLGNRAYLHTSSQTARALMIAAVDSQHSFTIENRDRSTVIAFARIQEDIDCTHEPATRYRGWQIQVDFSDFNKLRGNHFVLAAFDPAINVLHELVHGVFGYNDPLDARDELGQCERYVNRIRAELGMPLRLRYYGKNVMTLDRAETAATQLIFVDSASQRNNQRNYVVWFDLNRVVDINKAKSRKMFSRK